MGFYERQVVPRVFDVVMGTKGFADLRRRVVEELSGEVVEVGFGSGLNVPHYPPTVTRVHGVEPSEVARRLATRRTSESPIPVDLDGVDGEQLPYADDSVDAVLTTWTLCSIPDVERALREMRRVLRPGGRLHFLEHGHSPEPKVARWQRRLAPLQHRIAGGCHLDRRIDELIAGAGFEIDRLANFHIAGPKPLTYMYAGQAVAPGD